MVRGIDVSDYQGTVNWGAVASSKIEFAITKATEGATFVADTFTTNWAGIRREKLVRGAYHFFRPRTDPLAQADLFLDIVKLEPGDLPPVLDIESDDGVDPDRIKSSIRTWLLRVEQATLRRPIVYTYPSFWERMGNWQDFADYPLWIAHYTTEPRPWVPGGWRTWTMWQYTDRGSVNGVTGGVDVNSFNVAKLGTQSTVVVGVQRSLRLKGYDPGALDGLFGNKTAAATTAFQTALGLEPTGVVGPRTWAYLVDASIAPKPVAPSPSPTPEPGTTPNVPAAIELIPVMKYYQGLPHQNAALKSLQAELTNGTLLEFARRWRNDPQSNAAIALVDVAKYYQNLSSQNQALTWLQGQISASQLNDFAEKWRTPSLSGPPPIRLADAARYDQGLSHQQLAWQWLQDRLTTEELAEFARLWRQ